MENARDYVVTAEDLPVPDELLRSLPPHLPRSRLLSPAGLERRIRRAEYGALRRPVREAAAGEGWWWWRKAASGSAGRWGAGSAC